MLEIHRATCPWVVLATLAVSTGATAQTDRVVDTETGYHVEFEDGHLLGHATDTSGVLLRIRDGANRVLLIRPRASFLAELHESVEHM